MIMTDDLWLLLSWIMGKYCSDLLKPAPTEPRWAEVTVALWIFQSVLNSSAVSSKISMQARLLDSANFGIPAGQLLVKAEKPRAQHGSMLLHAHVDWFLGNRDCSPASLSLDTQHEEFWKHSAHFSVMLFYVDTYHSVMLFYLVLLVILLQLCSVVYYCITLII